MEGIVRQATPVVSASAAYTAGDAVGGKMTFNVGGNLANLVSLLRSAQVMDLGDQKAALFLMLFNQDFTAIADNAPFAPTDADLRNCIGIITLPAASYADFGNASVCSLANLNLTVQPSSGDKIFGQMWTSGTPTYAAVDDLIVTLGFEKG